MIANVHYLLAAVNHIANGLGRDDRRAPRSGAWDLREVGSAASPWCVPNDS
jgi:hypothetical protein